MTEIGAIETRAEELVAAFRQREQAPAPARAGEERAPAQADAVDATQVAELVAEYKQWTIGSDATGAVLSSAHFHDHPDRLYNLKNNKTRKFLQYEEQTVGINLGWTGDASPQTGERVSRWFFTRQEGTGGAVRYGETIALAYGLGRSFLYYTGRTWGINLDWSNPPVFEWQLLGGPTGTTVQRDSYLAIYNRKVGEFFTYFDRNVGGNIGWSDSERWEDILTGALRDLIRKYGADVVKAAVIAAMSL
jgi:hypothetical protein